MRPLDKIQLRMLAMTADGFTQREIGRELGITHHAVSRALSRMYPRMGATCAAHAVAIAIRHHLVPLDSAGQP